jgi:hypothetical protein
MSTQKKDRSIGPDEISVTEDMAWEYADASVMPPLDISQEQVAYLKVTPARHAAPKLLESLRNVLAELTTLRREHRYVHDTKTMQDAQANIAKAEGRA